jgi:hypothetical protein
MVLTTVATCAAEPAPLTMQRLLLPAGANSTPFRIGVGGAELSATTPTTLSGEIVLASAKQPGLSAAFFNHNLRGLDEADWTQTQHPTGTRTDATIDRQKEIFGSPAERVKFQISGSDTDWDDFSVQWDGWLRVSQDGTDLATRSDDGSRVWLDLNGNGQVEPAEWGSNGWGEGQGATQKTVHAGIAAGLYRIRVQYEDGGGPNCCVLQWRLPTGSKRWTTVPATAFAQEAELFVHGPVTLDTVVTGPGVLRLGTGAVLHQAPRCSRLVIVGKVLVDRDLDLSHLAIEIADDAVLVLAGSKTTLGALNGAGSLEVQGGTVSLMPSTSSLHLIGHGSVSVAGSAVVAELGDDLPVLLGTIRGDNRAMLEARLASPLSTIVALAESAPDSCELTAELTVPADAPAGLGVGAWRADREGRWFQHAQPIALAPGTQTVRFRLTPDDPLVGEGHRAAWSADAAATAGRIGLVLYAEGASQATIRISSHITACHGLSAGEPLLRNLHLPEGTAPTGKRWELAVTPQPYPGNPYDPAEFTLELTVVDPTGKVTTFAGFHDEPVVSSDRGDREIFTATAAPSFRVRFRPRMAGVHRLRLTAHWADRPAVTLDLPDVTATGEPWDDIARVDAGDPRFISAASGKGSSKLVWPAGCNLNSTYDVRSKGALQTVLTPDRGSFTRTALLERLAAGGGTGCEMWLSPWNLGLEWIDTWPGFRGTGRYHSGHAAAFDQILDRAEALGVRINVSLFNHGMGRAGPGAEEDWRHHPYNVEHGGWLTAPEGLFTDARAFTRQQALFRYLTARYADSPALLGWKLWAEVNLVHAQHDTVVAWHDKASTALAALDPWKHPITTHWCGDWKAADRAIAAQAHIGYITIDAYHGDGTAIAELLNQSTRDPAGKIGLSDLGKPVLVTEFGGSAGATSRERMRAEHAIGPWAGLVSGHGGSPMLWWFEWIDQEDRFGVYGAVNRFLAGEDLRGKNASCVAPSASSGTGERQLWCRAWARPGRMLGYIVDRTWGMGGDASQLADTTLSIGDDIKAGSMTIAWWDADRGVVLQTQQFTHPGGTLVLRPPSFSRHLAFKLWRSP